MVLIICVVFISCKTVKVTVPAENVESVMFEVKQYSGTSIIIEGIPVLAWDGVNVHTIDRYYELKECGIDYNFSVFTNVEQIAEAMDMAMEAGVRMIIYCLELYTEPEKIINRFKDHNALAGYYLVDEPNSDDFPYWSNLARRIQAIDNNHFCHVNLFPNYASSVQLGTSTYQEYVKLFLQEIPVPFLSFDYYPIRINDSGERFLRDGWYENLEIISDEAHKAGIPFWAFALTTAHWSYPIPTLADLRLQVYSNLAYGAQGIQYFTYWTPTSEWPDYNNGPIDNKTQQKTATWYTVQQMNKEIKALSSVFLGAQVLQVRHIVINDSGTDEVVPTGTTRFDFANKPSEANIIKTFIIPNNTNAVVSFLKNGNRCYMVVINRNLSDGDNVTFTITGDADLKLIKKDGTAVPAYSENSKQTVTPGDALIYGWDIKY